MKRPILLISLALLIVTACMIYLLVKGISLRAATYIKPSVADQDLSNVHQAVVLRLFPDFQNAEYVLWGVEPQTELEKNLLQGIQEEYERIFSLKVQVLDNAEKREVSEIQSCAKPCWLLLKKEQANELQGNALLEQTSRLWNKSFFSFTVLSFKTGIEVPEYCLSEKRLSYECLIPLSIRSAERKIKTDQRYFFLKKYNENDFFLFVQESKNSPDKE